MRRILGALLCLIVACIAPAQERMQIQFAEPVSVDALVGVAQFDAYGRRFNLSLQKNERLLKVLPAGSQSKLALRAPMRGNLADIPGSWVRLARVGDALEGAIWDGRELYVITSHQRVAANLTLPLSVAAGQTVIYRLSDTLQGLPEDFCGLAPGLSQNPVLQQNKSNANPTTALDKYKGVVSELRASAAQAAITDQLEIALIADPAFQQEFGATTTDAMLARLNTVDGIFAEQVGVLIVPTQFHLVPAGTNPLTSTSAQTLLNQLAGYRESNTALREAGLAHLMTGRDLDGDTAGIAYIDGLCDPREGVSLGESSWGEFLSALIMAHELGHNFGARHDGVPGDACASVPQSYLMAPFLNNSVQFSQCSLDAMAPVIARARGVCLTGASYADVGVQVPASPYNVDTSATFPLPITVSSTGTVTATGVRVEVDLPSTLTFQSAVLDSGSCALINVPGVGNRVSCTLGDIAAGGQSIVELRLVGTQLGSFYAQARVSAENDHLVGNNSANVQIGLQSPVDLGLTLTVQPGTLYVGDAIDFTVDVSSLRSQAAVGGTLSLYLGGIPIETISAGAHACTVEQFNTSNMTCQLAAVPAGTTTRIVVRGRPTIPNYTYASASINLANDGDFGNNHRTVDVAVRAERQMITTASTENLRAVIGTEYEVTYTLTTAGRLPSLDVDFYVEPTWNGEVLSVTPDAGTCAIPVSQVATLCEFGDLDPQDVRQVVVRLRMNSAGSSLLAGRTVYQDGTTEQYSYAHVWVTSNLRVDAVPDFGSVFTISEGQTASGNFGFQSIGIDPAQNVVVAIDLPAPARLTSLRLSYGPAGWACTIITPQQGHCTGSFTADPAGGSYGRANFDFTSDTPMEGMATVTLTADSDGNLANNVATAPLHVLPLLDVSVTATTSSLVFTLDQPRSIEGNVRTAHNPVPGVWLRPTLTNLVLELESVLVNGNDCPLTLDTSQPFFGLGCYLGDLPADANIPVSLRYRALQPFRSGQIDMRMYTARDSNFTNDVAFVNYETRALTDLTLSVGSVSMSGVNGSRVRFPLITVTNGSATAVNVRVNIPLPAFVSLDSVSSSAMCSGSGTLQCSWSNLAAGGSATIDLQLLGTGVGSFTSNVLLSADNDSTAGNNTSAVAVSFTAPTSGGGSSSGGAPSSGGGKKGGGGSLGWLSLAALALIRSRRFPMIRACTSPVMSRR